MAKKSPITEKQAIEFFQARKEELTKELGKVQATLDLLTDVAAPEKKVKKRKYTRRAATGKKPGRKTQAAKTKAVKSQATRAAVPAAKVPKKAGATAKPKTAGKVPSKAKQALEGQKTFNPGDSWDSKIAHALTQIGKGDKNDIVQFLSAKQKDIDPKKLQQAVALRLSLLLKGDRIKGKKEGSKYQYSLL